MNKDNQLIFEGYKQKRYITPKESLQRDKEFFNYVIESNDHLSSLKTLSTKKLFSSYVSTLANRINTINPGLIRESNMSDAEAFSILNEATQTVSDQEAYNAVKDIFEEIAVMQLIRKADLFLEADGDPNELVNRPMARRPGQRDAQGRMLPGQGAAQVQNQAQRDRVAGKMRDLRAANQTAAARIAELEAKIQEMEAAEANMNQQQKAQSDALQDQLAAMIKALQTNQNTNTNTINIGYPGNQQSQGKQQPATAQTQGSQQSAVTQKQPGVLSKLGSAAKKYLLNPTTLGLLGGAAGTLLGGGPLGGAIGGALGKGLGRAFNTKGSLGKKLGAGLGGAATGGLMGYSMGQGIDAAGDYMANQDHVNQMPGDTYNAPYADTNPSQPYTPGPEDGFQQDNVNSTGMPDEVTGEVDTEVTDEVVDEVNPEIGNPYGAETGAALPTAGQNTQQGDDSYTKRYLPVDKRKGTQKLMDLSRGRK